MRKTWIQKRETERNPEVEVIEKPFAGMPIGARFLIPTPREVNAYIRAVPSGSSRTISDMRETLAKQYGAEFTCPLTSGFFLRIVAEAAYEEMLAGKPVNEITPFWRAMDCKSKTAKKLSFGTELLARMRVSEGLEP